MVRNIRLVRCLQWYSTVCCYGRQVHICIFGLGGRTWAAIDCLLRSSTGTMTSEGATFSGREATLASLTLIHPCSACVADDSAVTLRSRLRSSAFFSEHASDITCSTVRRYKASLMHRNRCTGPRPCIQQTPVAIMRSLSFLAVQKDKQETTHSLHLQQRIVAPVLFLLLLQTPAG